MGKGLWGGGKGSLEKRGERLGSGVRGGGQAKARCQGLGTLLCPTGPGATRWHLNLCAERHGGTGMRWAPRAPKMLLAAVPVRDSVPGTG